jgi:hypothetical protein
LVDINNQPRDTRKVARTLLDELYARQLRERDCVGDGYIGSWAD